ncbi:MAG: DUF1838 domain-containing protein [Deltaproteobacteria bacterium]|nr:DUF1838 domain-containing protein [Kofleriaceae bacterium]
MVRIRCRLDGEQVITTWSGAVYAVIPAQPIRRLFDAVGMNVARCLEVDGAWHITSRELMYYLEPGTDRALARWTNPWTDETVPVVHVANRLVQSRLGAGVPLEVAGGRATLVIDVPLLYPNPLARDERTRPFSPLTEYQAIELFSLTTTASSLLAADQPAVAEMTLSWHREGPWLPWMNMGERQGHLLYRAHGRRVAGEAELAPLLRRELAERVPLYREAPRCLVKDQKNETSWTYFARALDAYLAGERFPLPASLDPSECS